MYNYQEQVVAKKINVVLFILFFVLLGIWFMTKDDKGSEVYYNIVFDTQGGNNISSKEVKEGYLDLPNDVEKEGYEFIGWMVDNKLVQDPYYISDNVTLVAKWEKIEQIYYTITFDTDGAETTIEPMQVLPGELVTQPENPVRDGYTFLGWHYNDELYNFNDPVNKDLTLKAKWQKVEETKNTYIVSFDLNGGKGNIQSQTIQEGGVVQKPTNPTRSGYTFLGWYYSDELYNFNDPVSKDLTLKAKWQKIDTTKKTYIVSFNLNGGKGNIQSQTIQEGGVVQKPTNPTRSGYTFKGWYYNDKLYNFNNPVNKDLTLKAKWQKIEETKNTYVVSFNLNGGKGNIQSQTIQEGGVAKKPTNPTRDGYTFLGWYYNNKSYNFNTKITKNITLVAMWQKNQTKDETVYYSVTFDSNNGTTSRKVVASGWTVNKPTNPTKSGYTFLGWYTKNKVQFDFSTKITSNITLYALWAPKLNYKANTSGNWIFVNNPETLISDDYLADSNYGKHLLFKTSFSGTAELFYSHGVGNNYINKVYYATRIYNPHSSAVTLKINKCGATMGWSASEIWKQYNNGTCSLAGKTYTIPATTSVIIYHNGNSLKYGSNDTQSSVSKVSSSAFEGVINMTVSKKVYIGTLVFKDIVNTYNSTYEGNYTANYVSGNTKITTARVYSGTYNRLPILTNNMTYEIYDQTPSGVLPISYTATNGTTYVSKPYSSYSSTASNKQLWSTHLLGGKIDTSNASNYKPVYYPTQYVGDFIKLVVPTSNGSFTLGPYKSSSETRNLYHATSGNNMRGWPHNWGNWGVHYKENITIKNNSNSSKQVTFRLVGLTTNQTVNVIYKGNLTGYQKNGSQKIWTVTVGAKKSVTVPVEIILGGHSNGGVTRELVLE